MAAPAIVTASSLMAVSSLVLPVKTVFVVTGRDHNNKMITETFETLHGAFGVTSNRMFKTIDSISIGKQSISFRADCGPSWRDDPYVLEADERPVRAKLII